MVALLGGDYSIIQDLCEYTPYGIAVPPNLADVGTIWVRDLSVPKSDGTHLIPYQMQGKKWATKLEAIITPSSANEADYYPLCKTGRGLEREKYYADYLTVLKTHVEYRQGKSAIEGGNCFVYPGCAIVGMNSVLATAMALEEQGITPKEVPVDAPSDAAFYAARNTPIAETFLAQKRYEGGYNKALFAPLEHRENLLSDAIKWEQRIIHAKQVIADELGLPLENIAFPPQTRYHLDLECLPVFEKRIVFLQDDGNSFPSVRKAQEAAFAALGLKTMRIEGAYKIDKETVNFFNGLYHNGTIFTNGLKRGYQAEEEKFVSVVSSLGIQVIFLDTARILNTKNGGLRCLTTEIPKKSV